MTTLKDNLSKDQKSNLVKFVKQIDSSKMLNEIEKLRFANESTFVRFLVGADGDPDQAFELFKKFMTWRKQNNVDVILDNEEINEHKIKSVWPNTWFHHDAEFGRPVWIFQLSEEDQSNFEKTKAD